MSRYFVVLCEDLQGWCFVYRALIEAGADRRDVFRHPFPDSRFHAAGGGSPRTIDGYQVYACGAQHVLMNYPGELAAVRRRNARRDTALVVHVDVDNATPAGRSVADRHRELDQACTRASVPVRAKTERIGWLVARREIETRIHFLLGNGSVDEHTSYPKLTDHEGDAAPAAAAFTRHARGSTTSAGAPPSLGIGLAEFRRVV